jgi:hypothetical protein
MSWNCALRLTRPFRLPLFTLKSLELDLHWKKKDLGSHLITRSFIVCRREISVKNSTFFECGSHLHVVHPLPHSFFLFVWPFFLFKHIMYTIILFIWTFSFWNTSAEPFWLVYSTVLQSCNGDKSGCDLRRFQWRSWSVANWRARTLPADDARAVMPTVCGQSGILCAGTPSVLNFFFCNSCLVKRFKFD